MLTLGSRLYDVVKALIDLDDESRMFFEGLLDGKGKVLAYNFIPVKLESENTKKNSSITVFSKKLGRKIKMNFAYKVYREKWTGTPKKFGAIMELGLPDVKCDKKKRSVCVFSIRKRRLDKDNLYAGAKPIFDSIKRIGWIYDDAPEYCNMMAKQRLINKKDPLFDKEGVWILVIE